VSRNVSCSTKAYLTNSTTTNSGVWNETEAWPLMFRSIDTVGALPMLQEVSTVP
jgi:hypothetical protein